MDMRLSVFEVLLLFPAIPEQLSSLICPSGTKKSSEVCSLTSGGDIISQPVAGVII